MCAFGGGGIDHSELFCGWLKEKEGSVIEQRNCLICGDAFTPNKYSPRQKVCSKPECQRARQIQSMQHWRSKHPDYFKYDESKGEAWLQAQRERSRNWRRENPEKIKSYRQTHIDEYRNYMRDYMRGYRQKKKQGPRAGEGPQTPPPAEPNQGSEPLNS